MSIRLLAIILSVFMLMVVIDLVRRHRLTFKYALAWLSVSLLGVFAAVFHRGLFEIAAFLGFELPSNFIFFTLFCVFVFLSLLLTVFLCQQNSRNDTMAQKLALLEFEINELKARSSK